MSELHKRLHMSRLPPMGPPGIGGASSGGRRGPVRGKRDFTPVPWDEYFEKFEDIKLKNGDTFRVYESGMSGPVCFFLHGGGYSGLSWAVLSKILTRLVTCRCAAVDFRGHGASVTSDDDDLSAEKLASDIGSVVEAKYGDDAPPIILVGHSMGGAIAVHVASKKLIPSLMGLAVIDVVEGTALDALSSMQSFLRGRPKVFKSVEAAIEWCVKTGQTRNLESAKVSMVGQVTRIEMVDTALESTASESEASNSIKEEEEEEAEQNLSPKKSKSDGVIPGQGSDDQAADTTPRGVSYNITAVLGASHAPDREAAQATGARICGLEIETTTLLSPRQVTHLPPEWDLLLPLA
ncbi:Protein phosphatase methylesterase 1 [Lamellibrachia satsuma]|nr:Protein phosphatase methylesterase 1 [Lamellibrachia satsuma]